MKSFRLLAITLAFLLLTSCELSEADVATSVAQTLEAQSTDTALPTDIPTATHTMMPATPTATSIYYQCEGISRTNLLENPDASQGTLHWYVFSEAFVDDSNNSNPYFVVRNNGFFQQNVAIGPEEAGQYALFIAQVSSERINASGSITGLPYLYGIAKDDDNNNIAPLQGKNMTCIATEVDEWVVAWGIFEIPPSTSTIRFDLNQALRRGDPQNGSVARFDDVGLYIFEDEVCARQLVAEYEEALLP